MNIVYHLLAVCVNVNKACPWSVIWEQFVTASHVASQWLASLCSRLVCYEETRTLNVVLNEKRDAEKRQDKGAAASKMRATRR